MGLRMDPVNTGKITPEALFKGLIKRGIPEVVAIAALANAGAESSFNPKAFNKAGGGQGAHGLFQWRGGRYRGLTQLGQESGRDPYDVENQLDFLVHELHGPEKATMAALQGVTNPVEAAKIFRDKFERPGGHGYGNTTKYAKQFGQQFLGHPYSTEYMNEGNAPSGLGKFAAEANKNASAFTRTAEMLGFDPTKKPKAPVPGMALPADFAFPDPATSGAPLSFGLPPAVSRMRAGTAPLRLPGEPPQLGYAGPTQPQAAPNTGPAGYTITPQTTVAAPTASSTVGTSGAASPSPEEADRPGFFGTVAQKLFPKSDDPAAHLQTFMGALGVGLGQMSGGDNVNLQPYFESIAARRQAAIDSQAAMAGQQVDEYNAITSRMQAGLLREKFEIEKAQTANAAARAKIPAYDEETIAEFLQDPNLAPLMRRVIQASTTGDTEARDAAIEQIDEVLVTRAKEAAKDGETNSEWGNLLDAVARDAPPDEIGSIMDRGGMESSDLNAAYDALGKAPTALAQNAAQWMHARHTNPALAKAMEQFSLNQAGYDQTPQQRKAMETAYEYADELDQQVYKNAGIYNELLQMENITKDMITKGVDSGPLNDWIASIGQGISQATGGALDAFLGERINDYKKLKNAEKTLALLIAKPMMEGGGAISDGERELMLDTIARGNMSNGTRLQIIQKLKALHEVDRIVAETYGTQLGEAIGASGDFTNSRSAYRDIRQQALTVLPELRRANQEAVAVRYKDKLDEFGRYKNMPPRQLLNAQAPLLTQEQYDLFKKAIPASQSDNPEWDGRRVWKRRNDDGTTTLMID